MLQSEIIWLISVYFSNGSGFEDIDVGNFTSALIQSDDGVFVCLYLFFDR